MKIKDIPKEGRPRERFLEFGPEALSDAELFAIILRTGTTGSEGQAENVVDMSNRLISEYGFEKLFSCSLEELQEIKGIGPAKAMQILAIAEVQKRHVKVQHASRPLQSAKDVFTLFRSRFRDEMQEHVMVLFLNNRNFVIGEKLVTKGIVDASLFHPREIFRDAIKCAASKIIVLHNHPSGDPAPSKADLEVTEELMKASDFLGIPVLDHVIIGRDDYWSYQAHISK